MKRLVPLLLAMAAWCGPLLADQDDPLYFTHDFEDTELYSTSASATPKTYDSPYGQWIYCNCSSSTNASYLREGMGARDLRIPKDKGAYVVLPVLDRGVKDLTFWEGRGKREISVYTSTDGGTTWTLFTKVSTNSSTYINMVSINDMRVNRIKLANEYGSDSDVDNISVGILAAGTKATVSTGDVLEVGRNYAVVQGAMTDSGDQPFIEFGFCWSPVHSTPTREDFVQPCPADSFSVCLNGLPAGTTLYYRAYAITGAGAAYGEPRSLTTLPAEACTLSTIEANVNSRSADGKTMKAYTGGTLLDYGGDFPQNYGVVYSTATETPDLNQLVALGQLARDSSYFTAVMSVLPNTTYYYRSFAVNAAGTAYGETLSLTTGDLVVGEYDGNILYCSPQGVDEYADGSQAAPYYTLELAAAKAKPGDTIYMLAGTYVYNARQNIMNHGTEEAPICLFAKGGRAVLDFSAMPYHAHSDNPQQGIRHCASYWHYYGLDITNASDNGMLIERNKPTGGSSADVVNATDQAHHNIIENCRFYRNWDTGLQMKNLASYNSIINCDSYLNCDEGQGDADGFAPKLSVGDGNYFYGCRAWLNSDDGWDVFYKKEGGFGDNMTVICEECISYKNGFLDENTIAPDGNGNGFKMGSDQGAMNVVLNRCLAVCNKAKGFDQNHNAGDIIMNNCTGMSLKALSDKAYSYRIYEPISEGHVITLTNCVAINDNDATDKIDKKTGLPKYNEDGKNGLYGRFQVDSVALPEMVLTTNEFRKAAPDQFLSVESHAELMADRDSLGRLPEIVFAHLKESSFMVEAGTPVPARLYRGIALNGIQFVGKAPDLGAYETSVAMALPSTSSVLSRDKGLSVSATRSGLLLIQVSGEGAKTAYTAKVWDLRGRCLLEKPFHGQTTTLEVGSLYPGLWVVTVEAEDFRASAKALIQE